MLRQIVFTLAIATTFIGCFNRSDKEAAEKICIEYKLNAMVDSNPVDSTIILTPLFQLDTIRLIYCDSLSLNLKRIHLIVWQSKPVTKLIHQSKRLARNYFTKTILKADSSTQIGFFMTLGKGTFMEHYRFQFSNDSSDFRINNAPALTDKFMTLKEWVTLDSLGNHSIE